MHQNSRLWCSKVSHLQMLPSNIYVLHQCRLLANPKFEETLQNTKHNAYAAARQGTYMTNVKQLDDHVLGKHLLHWAAVSILGSGISIRLAILVSSCLVTCICCNLQIAKHQFSPTNCCYICNESMCTIACSVPCVRFMLRMQSTDCWGS